MLLLFIPAVAFGQAGTTCEEEVRSAINNCKQRLENARGSDVSAFEGSSDINDGGVAMASAANHVSSNLGLQIATCQSTDIGACESNCTSALQHAQATNNLTLMEPIKQNMQSCVEGIDTLVSMAQADQAGLRSVASQSLDTADQACTEGQACGSQHPDVQKVILRCGVGYFLHGNWCHPYYSGGKRNPLAPN